MKELVKVDNDRVVTELKTVSEYFGKNHKDLIRNIKTILSYENTLKSEFIETTYKDVTGRTLPTYYITQKGFALLVMGFTGKRALKWKCAFYDEFEKRGREITELKIALSEKRLEETEQKLHLLHWDNYASTLGERLYTVTEIGKIVGMSAVRLNRTLADMNIQHREKGVWVVMDEIKECGFIHITSYEHDTGVNILTKWTEKGKNFIVKLLGDEKDLKV